MTLIVDIEDITQPREDTKKIRRCFDQIPTNRDKRVAKNDIFTCEDIISFLSICYHSVFH